VGLERFESRFKINWSIFHIFIIFKKIINQKKN
jgi:hypothetical protein